jgi:hypothetical protein
MLDTTNITHPTITTYALPSKTHTMRAHLPFRYARDDFESEHVSRESSTPRAAPRYDNRTFDTHLRERIVIVAQCERIHMSRAYLL